MNTYKCYLSGVKKVIEVIAETSFQAQQNAVAEFQKIVGRKTVKRSDITVLLVEKDGDSVVHNPAILDS